MSKGLDIAAYNRKIKRYLPQIIFLLFAIQPIMDVFSYWLETLGGGNTVSLLIRFIVLFAAVTLGFCLTKHRKTYIILGIVVVVMAVLHCGVCIAGGYDNPLYDLTNYIRVIQIPLLSFCFITFLRETGERGYRVMERGFIANFAIIFVVEAASAITGTNPFTYPNKAIGLIGWFSTTNSQSAILSAVTPVLLMQAIRKKNIRWLIVGTIVSFGILYLFATRLSYLAIFACTAGLIIVMRISRTWNKRAAAVLLAGAVVCGVSYPVSPMYRNQGARDDVAVEKQLEANFTITQMEDRYHITVEQFPAICLLPVYNEYLGGMIERFGVGRVMEAYGYSSNVQDLKDQRRMKILYCKFLMQDMGTAARLFGLELQDIVWKNETYDVENDFHGIYFLYGIVGLILFVLFLLYFIWLIIWALATGFSKYMTLEAGAFGIALCMLLIHAYFTAGVLRRPNASFYLSVVLAVIYYFVKIKPKTVQKLST